MNCRDVVQVELPTELDTRTETGWLVCRFANHANVANVAKWTSHPLNCRDGKCGVARTFGNGTIHTTDTGNSNPLRWKISWKLT